MFTAVFGPQTALPAASFLGSPFSSVSGTSPLSKIGFPS